MALKSYLFSVLLLNTLYLSSISSKVLHDGPCPNVEPMKHFKLSSFCRDEWYELAKYPNLFEDKGDCTSGVMKYENDKCTIRITEVVDKSYTHIDGYLIQEPTPDNDGIFKFQSRNITDAEGVDALTINVLGVDYDNYIMLYNCMHDEKTDTYREYSWIIAKTKTLEGKTKEAIDNLLEANPMIDSTKYLWEHFDEDFCRVKS